MSEMTEERLQWFKTLVAVHEPELGELFQEIDRLRSTPAQEALSEPHVLGECIFTNAPHPCPRCVEFQAATHRYYGGKMVIRKGDRDE